MGGFGEKGKDLVIEIRGWRLEISQIPAKLTKFQKLRKFSLGAMLTLHGESKFEDDIMLINKN